MSAISVCPRCGASFTHEVLERVEVLMMDHKRECGARFAARPPAFEPWRPVDPTPEKLDTYWRKLREYAVKPLTDAQRAAIARILDAFPELVDVAVFPPNMQPCRVCAAALAGVSGVCSRCRDSDLLRRLEGVAAEPCHTCGSGTVFLAELAEGPVWRCARCGVCNGRLNE